MKHNDFECRQCGAHFNSRAELQRHNKDQHSQYGRNASSNPSGMSGTSGSESESTRYGSSSSRSDRGES